MPKYKGYFDGKTMDDFEAPSLYAAKVKALEHFKPSKKKSGLVSVVLVEVDGRPVGLFQSNADFG